jgi:predicted lipoprotein with Yx(FWY)xxD motif
MITSHDRLKIPNRRRRGLLVVPAVAAGLAALAACSSSSSSSSSAPSSAPATSASSTGSAAAAASGAAAATVAGLKTASIGGVTVLTNAKGFTLYSFAPDTATKSATVTSPYTSIKRPDGITQLVFNGHPLYTFTGDTAPGTASGNGVNAFGGLWHEVPASGAAAPASSASAGSGGAGY